MTVIASTLSLLTNIFVMFVSSDVANGACQHASRDHQMHLQNIIAFYASPMEDHALKDTIYQVRKASADVVCATHCLQDESCKSFNYCTDKVCQLKAANNSINGSDIQLSAGCRHYGDEELQTEETSFKEASLCAENKYQFIDKLELQVPMTSPVRLEFTVNTDDHMQVYFSPNKPGEIIYLVELYADSGKFWRYDHGVPIEEDWNNVKYIGVPVILTYDNGRFEVTVKGVQDSTLTYDVTSSPQSSWFVSFQRYDTEAEIIFNEPCINDFNPQFE
ncbi:uncharacterized protein [Asterias amurensis]|uniref:uncharacterized protein n=1 Tax=Asterias amurensis TaxID=7602 RepID=UPI003AB1E5AC